MNESQQREEALIRNLQDAGCSQALIEQFLAINATNNTVAQTCILSKHRRNILHNVHVEQSKLDCLDYLIYQLKRKDP